MKKYLHKPMELEIGLYKSCGENYLVVACLYVKGGRNNAGITNIFCFSGRRTSVQFQAHCKHQLKSTLKNIATTQEHLTLSKNYLGEKHNNNTESFINLLRHTCCNYGGFDLMTRTL